MDNILVGIDGSEAAKQALRWALEEARCRDATLTVTMVAPDTRRSGMPYATRRGDVILEADPNSPPPWNRSSAKTPT